MQPKRRKPPKSFIDAINEFSAVVGAVILISDNEKADEVNMGTPYTWDKKNKIFTVFTPLLSLNEKTFVFELIHEQFESGELILKKESQQTLTSYTEYSAKNTDKDILEFFKDILSVDDFEALQMSLYLRSEQSKGRNISLYKKDIRDRFGDRGANIANLCTAGYFENEFMPIYEAVDSEDFEDYYELAVGKKARALFIHSNMGQDEIEAEFNSMIIKAQRYHLIDFRIHGLGSKNVSTINTFFANRKPEEDENFTILKEIERAKPPAVEYSVTFRQ